MKNSAITFIAVAIALFVCWYFFGSSLNPTSQENNQAQNTQIANPASTNCVEKLGGQLEIIDEANGQVGYCRLSDGRVCEEWALFRGNTCTSPSASSTTIE